MNFDITKYNKFIDMVSDSTSQLIFKKTKLICLSFGGVSKKIINKYLKNY